MSDPAGAASSTGPSLETPAEALPVKIVDAFAPAERLVSTGVSSFSRTLLGAVAGQLEAPVAELAVLEKATVLAKAHYDGIAEEVSGAAAHLVAADALHTALKPHFAQIDELDAVVGELEGSVRALDQQTKQLESLFATLM